MADGFLAAKWMQHSAVSKTNELASLLPERPSALPVDSHHMCVTYSDVTFLKNTRAKFRDVIRLAQAVLLNQRQKQK